MFKHCPVSNITDSQLANRDINNHTHIGNTNSVLEILYEKAAPGAFHISDERYDSPKCHEDTRIAIRQDLLDQVITALVSCVIWLYGAAGAGKSAIAQSFAETCEEQGLLIGSFFFFRPASLRNNAQRLAASLAYQLARAIPSTLPYIAHCITAHPAIFSSSLKDQIDKLFVHPLRSACECDSASNPRPKLIILDGLDECGTANVQRNIINVLETALQATPFPVVVLVASRPEIHISSSFKSLDRRASIPVFYFGLNDKYNDVDGDIRIYLHDKLGEIRRDHPFQHFLPEDWPFSEDIESVVRKSSDQFIYAATIIRYIGHDRCKPHERLQTALDASKRFPSTARDLPFKELDALYLQIFSGLEDTVVTLAILYLALDMDGSVWSTKWPRTIAVRLGLGPGDVELHIYHLASLMKFEGEAEPIRFFHASLRDFLADERRSLHLYINRPVVHTALAKACLRKCLTSGPEGPASAALDTCSTHLLVAELDQELFDLAAEVEYMMPGCIKAFPFKSVDFGWNDFARPKAFLQNYFSDFVNSVYILKDNIVRHTRDHTFWDRCLDAIHEVLHTQLSVYLTNEDTHDYLALIALTSKPVTVTSCPHLDAILCLSESASKICFSVDLFNSPHGHVPCHGAAQHIIENFLLDFHLSKELHISSERCALVAIKCIGIVANTRLSGDVGDLFHSDQEASYLWAVLCMTSMLRKASRCRQLIDTLQKSNCKFRWLSRYRYHVKEAQEVINLYLRTHSSHLPANSTTHQQGSEQLVDAVEDLSSASILKRGDDSCV